MIDFSSESPNLINMFITEPIIFKDLGFRTAEELKEKNLRYSYLRRSNSKEIVG